MVLQWWFKPPVTSSETTNNKTLSQYNDGLSRYGDFYYKGEIGCETILFL